MTVHKMNGSIESIMDGGKEGSIFYHTPECLREVYQQSVVVANKYNVARRLFAYAMHPYTSMQVRRELLAMISNESIISKIVLIMDRSYFRCTPWVFRDGIRFDGQSFEEATCIAMYLENQTWDEKVAEDRERDELYGNYYDDIEDYEEEVYEYN